MRVLTIDPGIKHLSVAVIDLPEQECFTPTITLKQLCQSSRLIYWNLIDITQGRKSVSQIDLCLCMITELDKISVLIRSCDSVGIEHQMSRNRATNAVQNQLVAYFHCRYLGKPIQMIMSAWKTKCLAVMAQAEGISSDKLDKYSGRKRWSIKLLEKCRELWHETEEELYRPGLTWQYVLKTWSLWDNSNKKDDLADTVAMAFGWWIQKHGKVMVKKRVSKQTVKSKVKVKVNTQQIIRGFIHSDRM